MRVIHIMAVHAGLGERAAVALRRHLHRSAILAAAGVLALAATVSSAALVDISGGNVTLDQLIGNSFIVQDKEFGILGFTTTDTSVIQASGVLVTPFNSGLSGIGFDLMPTVGTSIANVYDDDDESSDPVGSDDSGVNASFSLNYTVSILPADLAAGFRISDAHLTLGASVMSNGEDDDNHDGSIDSSDDNGNANISVTETYTGVGLNQILAVSLDDDSVGQFDQNIFLNNLQSSLEVMKVVDLFALGGENDDGDHDDDASVEIGFIRQAFSQTLIPEPASMALLALGGMAMLGRRR